ncbi:pseudouridine synthase [Haematococcus lacustris]
MLGARCGCPPVHCKSRRRRGVELKVAGSDEAVAVPRPSYHRFSILHEDGALVAVDKPRGFHVHRPEDSRRPCPREENGLWLLKQQLGGQWLFPLHRIDRATSGVVVYAKTQQAAAGFGSTMRDREVRKVYYALVRGYTDTYGCIDSAVGGQSAVTLYHTLARARLQLAVGKWESSRYSLLEVQPLTGRYHQIRRHLNHISHPIVGDGDHGDRYHNRAFAGQLGLPGMFLRAAYIQFQHPVEQQQLGVGVTEWEPRWHAVFDSLGVCPVLPCGPLQAASAASLADLLPLAAAAGQLRLAPATPAADPAAAGPACASPGAAGSGRDAAGQAQALRAGPAADSRPVGHTPPRNVVSSMQAIGAGKLTRAGHPEGHTPDITPDGGQRVTLSGGGGGTIHDEAVSQLMLAEQVPMQRPLPVNPEDLR